MNERTFQSSPTPEEVKLHNFAKWKPFTFHPEMVSTLFPSTQLHVPKLRFKFRAPALYAKGPKTFSSWNFQVEPKTWELLFLVSFDNVGLCGTMVALCLRQHLLFLSLTVEMLLRSWGILGGPTEPSSVSLKLRQRQECYRMSRRWTK